MKLIDTNRTYLPVQGASKRWLHLATVHDGVREFMCFADRVSNQIYIEEITGGHLSRIEDDSLAEALADYLRDKGILDVNKPTLADSEWLK